MSFKSRKEIAAQEQFSAYEKATIRALKMLQVEIIDNPQLTIQLLDKICELEIEKKLKKYTLAHQLFTAYLLDFKFQEKEVLEIVKLLSPLTIYHLSVLFEVYDGIKKPQYLKQTFISLKHNSTVLIKGRQSTEASRLWQVVYYFNSQGVLPSSNHKHEKQLISAYDKFKLGLSSNISNKLMTELTRVQQIIEEQVYLRFVNIIDYYKYHGALPPQKSNNPLISSLCQLYTRCMYQHKKQAIPEDLECEFLKIHNESRNQNLYRFQNLVEYVEYYGKPPTTSNRNYFLKSLGLLFHGYAHKKHEYLEIPVELKSKLDQLIQQHQLI